MQLAGASHFAAPITKSNTPDREGVIDQGPKPEPNFRLWSMRTHPFTLAAEAIVKRRISVVAKKDKRCRSKQTQ